MDLLKSIQNAHQYLKTTNVSLESIKSELDNIIQLIKNSKPEADNTSDVQLPSEEQGRLQRDVKVWLDQVEASLSEINLVNVKDLIDPLLSGIASATKDRPRASTQSVPIAGDANSEQGKEIELCSGKTQDLTEKVTPGFSGSGVNSGPRGQKVKVNVNEMLNINVIDDTGSSDEEKIIPEKKKQKKKNVKKQRKQKK